MKVLALARICDYFAQVNTFKYRKTLISTLKLYICIYTYDRMKFSLFEMVSLVFRGCCFLLVCLFVFSALYSRTRRMEAGTGCEFLRLFAIHEWKCYDENIHTNLNGTRAQWHSLLQLYVHSHSFG